MEFETTFSEEYFAGSLDYDHAGFQQQKNYQRECLRLIAKFRKELRDVQQVIKPGRHKNVLFEVMCAPDSELTRQCQQLGYKARRFGLAEGDLSTTQARRKLFSHLVAERPDHLWYSPECAPWCRWSTMNMSKSLDSLTHVLDARWQRLWQVALGVVLFEHQVTNDQHFHLEQPDGSAMLKLPALGPVIHVALPCKFDMCVVGGLVDPQSKVPIRKRMVVCTTSAEMRKALDHRKCLGEHPHFQVAGSTRVGDQTVPVSKFTEKYPRKFARQVCRILGHRNQYHCHEVLANEVSDSEEAESHPTKRRRLGEKSSPLQIALRSTTVTWENVMQAADLQAPRVGPLVVDHGDLITALGTLCPDYVIHHAVLCRGTDRMVGPNQHMIAGEAPWRRMICIRRNFEDICLEPEWEKWERLSHRQLRRNTTPARCSLTMFARIKYKSWSQDQDDGKVAEDKVVAPNSLPPRTVKRTGSPEIFEEAVDRLKRYHSGMAEEAQGLSPPVSGDSSLQDSSNVKVDGETRQMIDLVSQKHGPNMIALPQLDQSWLLKLHRNLGHPSRQKMEYVCKQLGCNSEILRAIPDIRCSTCLESRGPDIPRPSAVKEDRDFGDIIAMDGVTWKNSQGQQFHFYHMIDHSTAFHVAYCSPSRTAESVIRALTMGWIMWAGPPGQLILDAAGEFCDEKIQEFSQKHDIGLKVIPPEAHWQNGRCERHGGILQEMLTKMDAEEGINSYDQLEQALSFATQTKNQWSRHRGYPPELLVFGKMKKQPASITSDSSVASHALANSECAEGIRFRAELAVRESARKAFVQVDNDQACRRAILQRTRPDRGKYTTGDWIMMWRDNKRWFGPMRVIQQDADHCIWAAFGSRMYRASPEQVRPLSAVEEIQHRQEEFVKPRPDVVQVPLNPPQENQQIPSAEAPTEETVNDSQPSQGESPEHEPSVGSPSIANTEDLELERQINAPVGIPVPAETDDDLICEALHVTENQCWEIPIDLGLQEINQLLNKPEEEHSTFLVSAAKKQRSEVKLKDLTNQERELFESAKAKEIQSWLDTETIQRICRGQIPRENVLKCRWLLTWKENVDDPNKPARAPKARLIVLGYQDPLLCELERDSPTLSKLARMFIFQYAASCGWEIGSFDIRTAFLRGSDDQRLLGLEPPIEMRKRMGLADHEIVRLLKGAYGRVDAPLLWFRELQKGLTELQFTVSPFDNCLYMLQERGRVLGLIGVHVDDGLFCGTPEFYKKLDLLEQRYPFGSRRTQEFTFTGLHIKQHQDYSITIDQTKYVKEIEPIRISQQRRHEPQAPVQEEERQQLRGLIGSLQYASTNTRPDLGSRLSFLQSHINSACVETLIDGNRTLQEAKKHADTCIRIQPIPLGDIRFLSFSDAAFASAKNTSSHQGMLLMTAHKCIAENQSSVVNPILWSSRKIQKVAVSTLSAEAMALASAVDVLAWARLFWAWLVDPQCRWQLGDQTLLTLPPAFTALKDDDDQPEPNESLCRASQLNQKVNLATSIISTDCKSLYDIVSRTAAPSCQEFRTVLQAKLIREHLAAGVL